MASNTASSEWRRERNHQKLGQRRKKREGKKSTLSNVELFAGFGEPGQPAPKAAPATAAKPAAAKPAPAKKA